MNFFREIVEGFASGFLSTVANRPAPPSANGSRDRGRIDRLCRELGWSVDERAGDSIRLHFEDPFAGVRKVFISHSDEQMVHFRAYSFAVLPAGDVPQQVIGYLLLRNAEVPVGAWHVTEPDDEGDVLFVLRYAALGAGLTAGMFDFVCQSMVREAQEFDDKMRGSGLLE